MGLIKAVAYALLGYVLYELFLGISEGSQGKQSGRPQGQQGGSRRRRPIDRALNEDRGRMSGAGAGRSERTQDSGGASMRHNVGRGAIPQ